MNQKAVFFLLLSIVLPVNPSCAIFCPQCGNQRVDTFKFCPLDGIDLESVRGTLGQEQIDNGRLETKTPSGGEFKREKRRGGIVIPELPEEVPPGTVVVDLIRGELMNDRTKINAFTNDSLERMTGEKVSSRELKLARNGEPLLAFIYQNIYVEKYKRKFKGKVAIVHPGAKLPKDLKKNFQVEESVDTGLSMITRGGIKLGMKSPEVRLLYRETLEREKDFGRPMIYDREIVRKGFLTISYKIPKKMKLDYRVDFIFDKEDELVAVRFGVLKKK